MQCKTLDDIEDLLRRRVQRWRGAVAASLEDDNTLDHSEDDGKESRKTTDVDVDVEEVMSLFGPSMS